jgi:DNA-binding FadR family transcriptional regulator
MNTKLTISYILENVKLQKEIDDLKQQNRELKEDLNFHRSIFKTHPNSVVFNLYQKFKRGEKVWIDKINCDRGEITELDQDKDTIEWLTPVRCER